MCRKNHSRYQYFVNFDYADSRGHPATRKGYRHAFYESGTHNATGRDLFVDINTSDETTKVIMELAEKLGKTPTEVNDYPGFVANRILMPMINEAIETLYNGVAGVQEIDTIMKLGMAHPMGPLQLADFIGLDVCLSIINVMYDGFKNQKYAPCPLLVNMVMAKQTRG